MQHQGSARACACTCVQVEGIQTAAEAEVIELEDDEEKRRRATDPLYRLERGEESKKRALSSAQEITLLQVWPWPRVLGLGINVLGLGKMCWDWSDRCAESGLSALGLGLIVLGLGVCVL